MANILEEVQIYVADKLNSDSELSGLCPFIVENKKDVDYEIKQALGKQGVVGLVMTPKATYAGAYMDVGVAWQIDELEVDIVENVTVNRGKKDGYVTGQDAAMRLFEVMCPLSGENEGQFNPVSYEEGEDNSLLVNKCLLKCLVHNIIIPAKTIVQFADETSATYDIKGQLEINWLGTGIYPGDVVNVQIGDEVTGLGERSFTGFSQLSSIVVPKNVNSISGEAFSWTGLRNVVLENGVTELGYGVFSYSNSLSSITLPSTLTKIGADVFEECGSLHSVSIPKSVVNISQVAFRYSRLTELTMAGRTKEEVHAMGNYSWGLHNGCVIHCTDGDIVIGETTKVKYTAASGYSDWEGDIVGNLASSSIPNKSDIAEVQIGSHVTSIGDRAFFKCSGLTNVTIPNSVTSIGESSFENCSSLSSMTISNRVTSIGDSAFMGCSALTSVTIPNSVTNIGEHAFENCTGLTSVTIGNGVENIRHAVFKGCSGLASVTIPESVTSIYWWAFNGCTNLKNINSDDGVYLPDGIQTIGQYSFIDSGIEKLSFNNLAAMGINSNAFAGCNQLTDVVVRGVTTHEAMSLENYPWGISNENIIRGDRGV